MGKHKVDHFYNIVFEKSPWGKSIKYVVVVVGSTENYD